LAHGADALVLITFVIQVGLVKGIDEAADSLLAIDHKIV
jgi:hypothetical protein